MRVRGGCFIDPRGEVRRTHTGLFFPLQGSLSSLKESPMHRGPPHRMKIGLFSRESPMHRGPPHRMKIGLFSRETD
ncbi:hypothetical protein [Candidatus Hakubella thermalkaliphila]|uniref:hypothetical protein n=1 Tax=Candidatus Hakubella thermalkaliphila TaxID=2754717 RepID=UPI0015935D8E|nr:hypothetical protein [Candidatus Hakubella thermalkaliphila]